MGGQYNEKFLDFVEADSQESEENAEDEVQ